MHSSHKPIPLSVPSLQGNELKYLEECIETNWVSSAGPFVSRFEEEITKKLGARYAVACVNGTSALHISLIVAGVGPGDEVIVPTLTFIAPVNAVRYVGAEPVFMDCDDSLNLDPEKFCDFIEKGCDFRKDRLINRESGRRIAAVIPVHIFGHPVNLEPILPLVRKYRLKLIEDATESIGSFYKNPPIPPFTKGGERRFTGTIGDLGCLSFNGNKLITTGGGGMILTDDEALAKRARHLTTQAKSDELTFRHDEVGYNYRLPNLLAAVGCAQLEQLDRFIGIKRSNFQKYRERLSRVPSVRLVEEPDYAESNYWCTTLLLEKGGVTLRDRLLSSFREERIECRPVWMLNHCQSIYQGALAYRIEKADRLWETALSLPSSVSLSEGEIDRVVNLIAREVGARR